MFTKVLLSAQSRMCTVEDKYQFQFFFISHVLLANRIELYTVHSYHNARVM